MKIWFVESHVFPVDSIFSVNVHNQFPPGEDSGEGDGGGDGGRANEAGHDYLSHCFCPDKLLELLLLSQQHQTALGLSMILIILLICTISFVKYVQWYFFMKYIKPLFVLSFVVFHFIIFDHHHGATIITPYIYHLSQQGRY